MTKWLTVLPLFYVAQQEITLNKFPTEKLGISIRGGVDSLCGNPHDDTDKGIFVSKAIFSFFLFTLCLLAHKPVIK